MTALTNTSSPSLSWLVRRQNRVLNRALPVAVAAVAAFLLWQRHRMSAAQARVDALDCRQYLFSNIPRTPSVSACFAANQPIELANESWTVLLLALMALPVLLGAFVGAQSLAADLESGRHKLLWTQSVTPARWLAHRLAWPAAALTVAASALSLVNLWYWDWSRPRHSTFDWNSLPTFWTSGPVYPAAVLAAFLLGAAIGLLVRRAIAAAAVTLAVSPLAAAGLELLRPFLVPIHQLVIPDNPYPRAPFWLLSEGYLVNGHQLTVEECAAQQNCGNVMLLRVHTAGQFLPLQLAETGLLFALAAGCTWLAFWAIRRTR